MNMKISDALGLYRQQRQALIDQRKALVKQREDLQQKTRITENGKELFAEEAATLELSIKEVSEKFDKNQKILDQITEQHVAVWNAEVARQQGDVMQEAAVDLAKIMEVARRIARGARVPAKDEKKVMDYSMELYMSSKNIASMRAANKKEKYDSLWDDEDKPGEEYDPQGKADNATIDIDVPELFTAEAPVEASPEET